MSGHEFQVYFKDDETVDDLKKKVYEELQATGNDVKAFHLALVKDKNRLEDRKTLLESGVEESSFISVVVGDRKRTKRIMDVNIAADAGTKLTASSTLSSSQQSHPARNALPGRGQWMSQVYGPSWWCAEFTEPKIIGRLKFKHTYNKTKMSFRVEVGNDNVNWTIVFTEENETSPANQECIFDLGNELPSRFFRIYIENRTANQTPSYPTLNSVIMNEVVWD
jgi:hypothetical protein